MLIYDEPKIKLAENSLKELCQLDYTIAHRYESAIDLLESEEYIQKLFEFEADHHHHIHTISQFLKRRCKALPSDYCISQSLLHSKNLMQDIEEKDILSLIRNSEIDAFNAYEDIFQHTEALVGLQDFLIRALQDEIRHKKWFDQLLRN